jgi:hypothetical protein
MADEKMKVSKVAWAAWRKWFLLAWCFNSTSNIFTFSLTANFDRAIYLK